MKGNLWLIADLIALAVVFGSVGEARATHSRKKAWDFVDADDSDDYIDVEHKDGAYVGMRAAPRPLRGFKRVDHHPLSEKIRSRMGASNVQDDDDDEDDVIHVIRRPLHADDHHHDEESHGVLHHLGSKLKHHHQHPSHEDEEIHRLNHLRPDEFVHSFGDDVSMGDFKRIRDAIRAKKKRDKIMSKQMRRYSKQLRRENARRGRGSSKASKKLSKMLKKENKRYLRRRNKMWAQEDALVRQERIADRLDQAVEEGDAVHLHDAFHHHDHGEDFHGSYHPHNHFHGEHFGDLHYDQVQDDEDFPDFEGTVTTPHEKRVHLKPSGSRRRRRRRRRDVSPAQLDDLLERESEKTKRRAAGDSGEDTTDDADRTPVGFDPNDDLFDDLTAAVGELQEVGSGGAGGQSGDGDREKSREAIDNGFERRRKRDFNRSQASRF